ncbi:MAG: hypothetical protein IIC21_09550, partial [Chloroflexi bacterium]|nr:hypothetical protein [Chloroflexota bacterium]
MAAGLPSSCFALRAGSKRAPPSSTRLYLHQPGESRGAAVSGLGPIGPQRVGGGDLPEPEAWRGFLTQLVTAPEALPGYAMLKSSRGSEVFRATLTTGDRSIAVVGKQSRLYSLRRRLSAMTQGLRETRNFRKGARLIAAGIDTALPLALVTRHSPRREAWLITEFLADVVNLDQVARDR